MVQAPPLFIQEKVHPKVLIDDLLLRRSKAGEQSADDQLDLFADFNGLPDEDARTEFYRHDVQGASNVTMRKPKLLQSEKAATAGKRATYAPAGSPQGTDGGMITRGRQQRIGLAYLYFLYFG